MALDHDLRDKMAGAGGVRNLVARWVIQGEIRTTAAAHLGTGDEGAGVDMALLRDRVMGRPLLTGASLAGGLRSYLADLMLGYRVAENKGPHQVERLFGGIRGDDQGDQSPLIVFDSIGELPEGHSIEIRDGVTLCPERGTARPHQLYNLELLPKGTRFYIRLELLVENEAEEEQRLSLLVASLQGLEQGEIPLGARKSRGLGACRTQKWRTQRFHLGSSDGWLKWLLSDHCQPIDAKTPALEHISDAISAAWGRPVPPLGDDQRRSMVVTVGLEFTGGLLIRSPSTEASGPDVAHLQSGGEPVLAGTSLAGALRARALRIAHVVRDDKQDAEQWVDRLFGTPPRDPEEKGKAPRPVASRLRVTEEAVGSGHPLRPMRIQVDRFTGGVVDGALFEEEPHYRGKTRLRLELREPEEGEPGLLLLLLKDLLTEDLVIGGTGSVGRGVARGSARVKLAGQDVEYPLDPTTPADVPIVQALEEEVKRFHVTDPPTDL